jgi:hypothetical protein
MSKLQARASFQLCPWHPQTARALTIFIIRPIRNELSQPTPFHRTRKQRAAMSGNVGLDQEKDEKEVK